MQVKSVSDDPWCWIWFLWSPGNWGRGQVCFSGRWVRGMADNAGHPANPTVTSYIDSQRPEEAEVTFPEAKFTNPQGNRDIW